jgi:hypothetical protein
VAQEIEPRPPERIGNGQHIADQVLGAVRIDLDRPHARRVAPLVERHRAEPGGGERRQLPEPGNPCSSSTPRPETGPAASPSNVPAPVAIATFESTPVDPAVTLVPCPSMRSPYSLACVAPRLVVTKLGKFTRRAQP